jgi:hypothetical protein
MVLRFVNLGSDIPTPLLVVQLSDYKSWNFSASKIMGANSHNKVPLMYLFYILLAPLAAEP